MLSVLYVDDEETLLEIGKLFLEKSGTIHVDTVSSPTRALEMIQLKQYDAIVSDYQMPGMDGIQFLEILRTTHPGLPFIIFTGRGREEVVIKAFEKGADFYLQKGGDPKSQFVELIHKIQVIVDKRRAEVRIITLNRLYATLSATNRAIVYISEKDKLLAEICRIIIDNGGFSMAWAGILNPENRIIEPVASYGPVEGYLDHIAISADAGPRGYGPTSSAFRDTTYNICNDIETDERMKYVREPALKRGFRSLAAFRFAAGTVNAGVITIYSDKTGFFDEPIIALLDEMLQDVTFALSLIDFEDRRLDAEKKLLRAKKDWEVIFQAIGNPAIIMDARYTIIEANAAVQRFCGKSSDEIRGLKCWEIFHEPGSGGPVTDCPFERIKQYPHSDVADNEIRMLDGIYMVSVNPVFDEEGHLEKVIHIATDITERKKTERSLRDSEVWYRTLFQGAAEGILVADLATQKFLYANAAICTLLGYTEGEITSLSVDKIHPAKDLEYVLGEFSALSSGFKERAHNIPCLRKDGTVFFTDIATSRMSIDGRESLVGFFTDITDRLRAETALQENLAEYRKILRTAMDGFCIVDLNGTFFDVNDAFCQILGYTKQEILKLSLESIEMQENRKDTARHIQKIMQVGHDRFLSRYRCKDGHVIDVEVSVVYSRFHGGRFFSFHRELPLMK